VEGQLMRAGDFRRSFVEGPPPSVSRGPVLAEARYPDVLVAKALSHGEDLDLVLHPGAGKGPRRIGIERLKPGAAYRLLADGPGSEFEADDRGAASLLVDLQGRTALRVEPV
jgi:hypothetical protein